MMKKIAKIIAHAIRTKRETIKPAFQPVYNADSGKIYAYEALARIIREDTILFPDTFIPVAEEYGLIHHIDTLVLQKACEAVKNTDAKLFVNIHPETFTIRRDFPDIVLSIAKETNMNGKLYLEITERKEFAIEEAVEKRLNDNGIYLVIDDFGKGFSNLTCLKTINAPVVKINGDFVRNMNSNKKDFYIVKHMAELLLTLQKEVIAEFVENEAVKNILSELGIKLHQGFHYAKPSFELNSFAETSLQAGQ